MEEKCGEEPGSSKITNLIIITPEELAKLGLSPDIIHTSGNTDEKPNDKNASSEKRSKRSKKSVSDNKKYVKYKEKVQDIVEKHRQISSDNNVKLKSKLINENKTETVQKDKCEPIILNSTILNSTVNVPDIQLSRIKENPLLFSPSMSSSVDDKQNMCDEPKISNSVIKFPQNKLVLTPTEVNKTNTLNTKLTIENKVTTEQLSEDPDSSGRKMVILNSQFKFHNENQERRPTDETILSFLNVNIKPNKLQIEDNGNIISSNSKRETHSIPRCFVVNQDNTTIKDYEKSRVINSADNSPSNDKEIKITGNTSVHLSNEELKQLIANTNMQPAVGKCLSFCQKNKSIAVDKDTHNTKNFEEILKEGREGNNLEILPKETVKNSNVELMVDNNVLSVNKAEKSRMETEVQVNKNNMSLKFPSINKLEKPKVISELEKAAAVEETAECSEKIRCYGKISTTIPKKRKYITYFAEERDDSNSEIIQSEEVFDESEPKDNDCSKNEKIVSVLTKNSSNELLMVPQKRGRKSKLKDNNCPKNEKNILVVTKNSSNELLAVPKKRGRRSRIIILDTPPSTSQKGKSNNIIQTIAPEISQKPSNGVLSNEQGQSIHNQSCKIQKDSQNSVKNVKLSNNDDNLSTCKSDNFELLKIIDDNVPNKVCDISDHEIRKEDRSLTIVDYKNEKKSLNQPKQIPDNTKDSHNDLIVNNVDIKMPRKRGRPKKNSVEKNNTTRNDNVLKESSSEDFAIDDNKDFEDNSTPCAIKNLEDEKECNESTTAHANTEENVTSTPLPKKRGRKRKSEQPPVEQIDETVMLDQSRSGRKIRKINYLELSQWEKDDDDDDAPKKRRKSSSHKEKASFSKTSEFEETHTSENTHYKNVIEDCTEDNSEIQWEKDVDNVPKRRQNSLSLNEKPSFSKVLEADETLTSENSHLKNVTEDVQNNSEITDVTEDTELSKCDESVTDESSSAVNSDSTNRESRRKNKYNKTGETVVMLNSVFAAAFKNNTNMSNDENISDQASLPGVIPMDTKSGPGRRRKSQEFSKIIVDEDDMVTCMLCNIKVKSDEWITHNKNEHYNLAWRDGEQAILLSDNNKIAKLIRPILQEDKILKCKKCNHSSKSVPSFIGHLEKCSGILSSSGMVTCAICNMEIEKKKWPNHKQRQHNNLAWRVGDRPLNLNDQNLVVNILTALYKAKKPLYCNKCNTSKKSVLGFLSHQSQCGILIEEAKVQCQFCKRKVLPVSMQSHIKLVHETSKETDKVGSARYFDVDADATITKRKAARTGNTQKKQAMLVINKISSENSIQERSKHYIMEVNFNEESFVKLHLKKELSNSKTIKCKFKDCSYESDSVMNLIDHMNYCQHKPEQYYTCKKCLSIFSTEGEMKEHLKNTHNIEINVDDEYQYAEYDEDIEDENLERYEEELKRASRYETLKMERNPALRVKPTFILGLMKTPFRLFSQSFNFTMSFCQEHYFEDSLFKNLRCSRSDLLLVDEALIEDYLPKCPQSCDVAKRIIQKNKNISGSNIEFKKFELFETDYEDGIATIFCGGPIQSLAWLPTPYSSMTCRQVLAVAPLNGFDRKFFVSENYYEQSVIQFWDFGILTNKHSISEPKLMFCLAHDFGPVWHLEWCPSGCFDINKSEGDSGEMSRLGILAVAGSDSAVYIYAIPELTEEQMGLTYKLQPLLKLQLFVAIKEDCYLSKEKFYATKISWSKASGHKYMAIGYTNGTVGLFNVNTASNLLKCMDADGCEILLPYRSFQPNTHAITVLDFIHLSDGKRWLLTGSYDRNLTVWDLNNDFKITTKTNILYDGVWLTNWMAFLGVCDESFTTSAPAFLTSYRNYLCERVYLTNSLSSIKTASESSWLNGIIYCSAVGEIVAMFPPQLLYGLDNDKGLRNYIYLFGYTELINKQDTPEETLVESKPKPNKKSKAKTSRKTLNCTGDISEEENVCLEKYQPFTYQEANEKYGLLFCDIKMDSHTDFVDSKGKKVSSEEFRSCKANLYPMQAINKVAYNPNRQASLYYAVGYQAGFVRVAYMKFLENDSQIK